MTCDIPLQKMFLVDLFLFYQKYIESKFLTDCSEYGLIRANNISINNKDVQKLFLHYLIYTICDYIIENKNLYTPIFILQKNIKYLDFDTLGYMSFSNYYLLFKKSINKLIKALPIIFKEIEMDIMSLCNGIIGENGDCLDILQLLKNNIKRKKMSNYSLNNAKKFTKKYDLNFLNREYLNDLYVRMNLCIK